MNQIRTKAELLAFFVDNTDGGITEQMMRDFVVSSQVLQTEVVNTPGASVSEFADLVLVGPGGDPFSLPPKASYGERTMTIANGSGGQVTIMAAPGETINGAPSIILDDEQFTLIGPDPTADDWIVIVRTTKPKRQVYQVMCSDKQNTMPGDLIRFGDTQSAHSIYVIPANSQLVTVTISRSDNDPTNIEILKNGAVVGAFLSDEFTDVVSGVALDFDIGDTLQVRNSADFGSSINNPVIGLLFEII